jgi:hypothetical protein
MRTRKRKVRRSERGKGRRGFKPDVAAGSTKKPERNHIRLRGVGFQQYRKSVRFPQGGIRARDVNGGRDQNGFTTTIITIPIIKMVGTSLITR